LARDELTAALQEQKQKFHRNALYSHGSAGPAQFKGALVYLVVIESKHSHECSQRTWIGTRALL
jgi:hypothetical protein